MFFGLLRPQLGFDTHKSGFLKSYKKQRRISGQDSESNEDDPNPLGWGEIPSLIPSYHSTLNGESAGKVGVATALSFMFVSDVNHHFSSTVLFCSIVGVIEKIGMLPSERKLHDAGFGP